MGLFKDFYLNESNGIQIKIKEIFPNNWMVLAIMKGAKTNLSKIYHVLYGRFDVKNPEEIVGVAEISKHKNQNVETTLIEVDQNYRRQGIATLMYKTFEKQTKLKISPSSNQTEKGKLFRKKYDNNEGK